MMNTSEKSTILLLCLGLDSDKTEVKRVDVAELRSLFDGYGELHKVIIFTRKLLLKAFLEYSSVEEAEAAKRAVHETFVKSYGKARLYFSPMQELRFSNKYLEYWEADAEKPLPLDDDVSTKLSLAFSTSVCSQKQSFRLDSRPFVPQSRMQSSRSEQQQFANSMERFEFNQPRNFMTGHSSFGSIFEAPKRPALSPLETSPELSKANSVEDDLDSSQSSVVLVSNLGYVFRSTDEIFNLFSSFGNITKILFMMNLQKALIEYTDSSFAAATIASLNDLPLGETKLHVSASKYKKIDLHKNNKNEASLAYNQVMIVPPARNRLKPNSLPLATSISSTLLISYNKNANVQTLDVYVAIERICKPSKTKLVSNKGASGKSEQVNMLFTFPDAQSAVYVMYKCHNITVKGALLDIFFF